MYHYLLRRLLITVPTVLGISVVLFSILALAPGDPFEELALNPDIPVEVRLQLRHQFGLDDALPLRYLHWLTAMLRGEWGYSFASRVSVIALIWQRLPTTLFVLGSAYGLALCIALPVGIVSAGGQAVLPFRPPRHHRRFRRPLPANLFHRPALQPALQPAPGLAPLYLQHDH